MMKLEGKSLEMRMIVMKNKKETKMRTTMKKMNRVSFLLEFLIHICLFPILISSEAAAPATTEIIDSTEQNLVAFRREVYLTIQSSLDYQEAAHKLLKMNIKPELEVGKICVFFQNCLQIELCHMLVDCCTQSRTYERFYGLLCERFCRLKKEFQDTFEQVARDTYATVHRFEITKLRNIARLISHLLFTDAISWMVAF